jgi:uncharacterized BrkB/YihY/UPF0761 family membrane protein
LFDRLPRRPAVHIIRQSLHIVLDTYYRFDRDDGWTIASHITLSILMSVFPFLIVVTAIAAFIGSPAFYSRPGRTRSRARSRPKSIMC